MKSTCLLCTVLCTRLAVNVMSAIIPMGAAEPFGVLASSTVTNTGLTRVEGDLGVYPGTAISGFLRTHENEGPGTFTGTAHQGDAVAGQAREDALNAYTDLNSLDYTLNLTGQDLGGLTLAPGVYRFDTSAQLTGKLTLDGKGLYVFQIGSTLTTAANSSLDFLNHANPYTDVYWRIGSSSTFGANTLFGGTVIADQNQTLNSGARMDGRVIALHGAVTLDNNIIHIPELSSLLMMALAVSALILNGYAHRPIPETSRDATVSKG